MSDMDFEERYLFGKYLTLTKLLLQIAEDFASGKTTTIDFTAVEEIVKEQIEIMNRLTLKDFL